MISEKCEVEANADLFSHFSSVLFSFSCGRCRLEMLYAANIPVVPSSRFVRFAAGLRIAAEAGRRPHLLYGTKESVKLKMPIVLPPLLNSYLDEYNPATGHLTVDSDREKIMELMEVLKSYMKQSSYGYNGACISPCFVCYFVHCCLA